ncbi:Phosphorylcholine metabolism protein LicD [Butyrivibrio sp. INlla18]|uniref:LicD family protein n=1 Tax=Butyrivibrio sp. INlla18 TaxID=1520806 RepID=UPI00088B3891|nr:LicD family protein [Butyrivibrio sp. INlla18]SDA41807.1 Phosphorylcholine metabolism protein LicD [Butyrivibrio sp. INlla18]
MLNFPDNYFKDEVREGFLVSETMKRTWGSQLEIFDKVRNLCNKYDITYFAEVGTLLGAARHNGIIPWDDDIDIAMLRDDYNRFLAHCDEMDKDLCVRSIYSSDTFYNFHAVVTQRADILEWDFDRMEKYHGCPFICSVDVFPLDYYPSDAEAMQFYGELYCLAYKCVYDLVDIENEQFGGSLITIKDITDNYRCHELYENIQMLKKILVKRNMTCDLNEKEPLRNQLCLIVDNIAQSCREEDAAGVEYCPKLPLGIWKCRPKHCYKKTCELPFEMTTITVPEEYKEVLSNIFGEDYMMPVRGAAGHEYPFFRDEVNVLVGGDIGELYLYSEEKKKVVDSVNTLQEAFSETMIKIQEQNIAIAKSLLGQIQDFTFEIEKYVEKYIDEKSELTKYLDKYCRDIYKLYTELDSEEFLQDEKQITKYFDGFSESIKLIKRTVFKVMHREIPDKIAEFFSVDAKEKTETVIIGISATGLLNNSYREIDKLTKLINDYDKENTRIFVFASKGLLEFLKRSKLNIENDYIAFLEAIKQNDQLLLLEDPNTDEIDAVLSMADTYIGDKCRITCLCGDAGLSINCCEYND